MNIKINFKNQAFSKSYGNLLLFVDEKFNISSLKKLISVSEYSYIQDLLKNESLEKKIITFDISSKRKIILISLKNNSTKSDAENLGAKCYDLFKKLNKTDYILNSNSIDRGLLMPSERRLGWTNLILGRVFFSPRFKIYSLVFFASFTASSVVTSVNARDG